MIYDVLVLEDSVERMKHLKQFLIGFSYLHSETASYAISLLKEHQFKYILLDHDLADIHYEIDTRDLNSSLLEKTGQYVADWIAYNKPQVELCIIHSLNPIGGKNMFNVLKRNDIPVIFEPGCWTNYDSLKILLEIHNFI